LIAVLFGHQRGKLHFRFLVVKFSAAPPFHAGLLFVSINHNDLIAFGRQTNRNIASEGRFANAPFLLSA
jgi:hypothetical protein